MSRIACARSLLALACILALTQRAHAQTSSQPTTIPLDVISESGGGVAEDRLGINIGVNGAAPEEYIFDTGSTAFNIDVGSNSNGQAWFPIVSGVPITPTSPALTLYGDGTYGNLGANTTVSSVQFYSSSSNSVAASFANGQGIPVLINQGNVATATSLGGDQAGAQVGYYLPTYGYSFTFAEIAKYGLNTQGEVPIYLDATWQQNLNQGIGPEDGGTFKLFGIFGAGEFGSDSVLGNLTTSGYIVAANAELGTPQNCSGCGHVILNLTPALRAQFLSLVPWNGGSQSTFPLSGAPVSANQFDLAFAYTLNGGKYSATLQTLLDSGTPTIYLNDAGLLAGETAAGHVDANGNEIPGVTLTMTGSAAGAQPTSIATGNDGSGDLSNVVTPGSNPYTSPGQALYGISFFFNNSVMYDLQNQETGYTPFFVSIDPISTTGGYTISAAMPPQGIAGIISGNGPLMVASGGMAQLTGANTYTGATQIAQGGWLGLAGPGTIADSSGVQADGTLDISRVSAPALIQSLSGAGNVALGANTLELTNASGTFAGVLADGGLVGGTGGSLVIAQGMETLTGSNTFTGSTGISPAGGLTLNGSLAGSVLDAGLLEGHGTIGGGLVVTGVIAPGNGSGTYQTLTVVGNYLQNADSTYVAQVNLAQPGTSSQIMVQGKAVVASGAQLSLLASPPSQLYTLGTRYTLLSAAQGLTGTYTLSGNTSLSATLGISTVYDADHFYLDVIQQHALIDAGYTRNQVATLAALQSLPASSASFIAVSNLATDEAIRHAADILSGDLHASVQSSFFDDSRLIRDAVTERLRLAALPDDQASASTEQKTQTRANGLTWWGQFVGSWDRLDGNGNAATLSDTIGGFLLGADMPLGDHARVGLASGYTQTGFQASQRGATGNSDDAYLSVYAGTQLGSLALRAGAAYTQHSLTMNRSLVLPDMSEATWSRNKAYTAQVFGEAGYAFAFKAATLEPFAQAAHVALNSDGFQERGGASALSGSGSNHAVTYTTLGAHVNTHFAFNGDAFTAYGTLGWRHASGYVEPYNVMAFANSDPFTVQGVPIARNALVVDAGLMVQVTPAVSFSVAYDGQLAHRAVDSGFKGGVTWRF
ncbi:autotransporter outer membrane beta-barrel domain-containing protein [Dyella nitratireducens]|uniref:Autotransporter domain-containing protein n=1 Tax=Dyella nitratireducens TaxID=1849580 RepID=A0ABQ1GIE5_9GAMM|nr:autotransporter domain-containing protein [Dyella nitratireducens]GGA44220.1 hypothetical protein GCM10010981_36710 [Dyella nitratireducens]GLQ41772.1 hypothetical protein GCM10007902_16220 [Dyella nitratireducens]